MDIYHARILRRACDSLLAYGLERYRSHKLNLRLSQLVKIHAGLVDLKPNTKAMFHELTKLEQLPSVKVTHLTHASRIFEAGFTVNIENHGPS